MAIEVFKLFGSIMVDNEKANKSISDTDKKAESLGKRFISGIGTAAKWGAGIAAAAGSAAIALGTVATKAAIDFQSQMSNVATLLDGDVNKRIAELGESVKKVSKDTGASTDLLTDGLYQVISAFGDTSDSMAILETAALGAKAGNATVTDSVNLLAAVTKGYGDTSAEAASKASDLAFLTVKLGQTSFPELASSMGKVIPLASTMKVSQEELFGAMATLTGVTGNTAEVTTQLRATIQGMLQPTTSMASKISELGYENGQAMIESLGLQGTLEKLKESVGGNEIAFSELFGSVEAKNAVLSLTGAQAENFTEKTNAMKDAVGATGEAFAKQTDNVKANWAKLKNTFDVMMISLGEKFLPILNELIKWVDDKMPIIESALNSFCGFIDRVIEGFSLAKEEFEATGEYVDWFATLWETIFGIELPQTFYYMVDGIITAFFAFWETMQEVIESIAKPLIDGVKLIFDGLMQHSDTIFTSIAEFFYLMAELIKGTWETIGVPVFDMIMSIVGAVGEYFAEQMPCIAGFFSQMVDDIRTFWENNLKPCFEAIGDFINNVLAPAFEFVFKNIIGPVVDSAFKLIQDLWNNTLKPVFTGITDFLTGVFTLNFKQAWEGVSNIFSGIWNGLVGIAKSPLNAIIGMINQVIGGLNKLKLPDWVPGIGGLGVNIPEMPMLAKGTNYFSGSAYGNLAIVGEQGPELVNLPTGAKVNTAKETKEMLGGLALNIENFINNREQDIEDLADELAFYLKRNGALGGA